MKLDKITDEVRLLGRENISTDEQLFSYMTSLEEQMKNLIAGRTHLRKKIRTNIDDGQLQAAKDEIASIKWRIEKTPTGSKTLRGYCGEVKGYGRKP